MKNLFLFFALVSLALVAQVFDDFISLLFLEPSFLRRQASELGTQKANELREKARNSPNYVIDLDPADFE